MIRSLLRRLMGLSGHQNPVPEGMFRLVLLNDNPWLDYSGTRSWCDARKRSCPTCGGQCCQCRHTERKNP